MADNGDVERVKAEKANMRDRLKWAKKERDAALGRLDGIILGGSAPQKERILYDICHFTEIIAQIKVTLMEIQNYKKEAMSGGRQRRT